MVRSKSRLALKSFREGGIAFPGLVAEGVGLRA